MIYDKIQSWHKEITKKISDITDACIIKVIEILGIHGIIKAVFYYLLHIIYCIEKKNLNKSFNLVLKSSTFKNESYT